ncbi:hypothetical protein FRC04_005720 [Tulasnella sp. 424]|nr:hypothetical protein FRC04_005720 [Tulasnella sp. 424]KAG8977514.1 hypothetical protein FRC05_001372 [Tulasnella sp. 425]
MHILATGDYPEADPDPVLAPLNVDPPMAPPIAFLQHPPSEPPSPLSSASDESSDEDPGFLGFRVYNDQEHDVHAVSDDSAPAFPSTSSYLPTPNSPSLPVSLPLDSPRWKDILAANLLHHYQDNEKTDNFARAVESASKRVLYLEEVERLRVHNRQATITGQPLAPIPNVDGLTGPLV